MDAANMPRMEIDKQRSAVDLGGEFLWWGIGSAPT